MRLLTRTHPFTDALIGWFLVLFFLAGFATAGTVDLAWTANTESDIAGYKVVYGTASGSYTQEQSVGISPATTLTGLTPGSTYYIAVQAVTVSALTSPLSEEISFTVPQVTAPEISLEQTSGALLADGQSTVSLGDVSYQSTTSRSLTIRNLGSATLTGLSLSLDGADASSFDISGSIPYTLLAATNGSFESEFTGWTATGNVRAQQNAAATSGASLVEFNASETQPNGVLTQTFATVPGTTYTLSFDAGVLSYNSNPQVIQTTVTGTGTLLSKSISLTGPNNGSTRWSAQNFTFVANSASTTLTFADLSTTTAAIDLRLDNVRVIGQPTQGALAITSLAPGASTTFDVIFKPGSVGTKNAALHITSNDADENPFDFALTANATGLPEISVRRSPSTELTDGASSVVFSSSVIGTSSAVETLIIQNTGTANLTNIAITTDGAEVDEFVVIALAKSTLAPGETTTIQAYFQPASTGTKSAAIHIASSDSDENPFDIALVGNGLAIPQITVSKADGTSLTNGATLAQGSVNLGSTATSQIITLRNSGTGNLTDIALTIDGGNPGDFLIEAPTTNTLVPGSSTDFKITFKPTAAGLRTAAIHIASSDADHSPFDLAVTGTGIATPEIAVTLDDSTSLADGVSLATFGNVNIGSTGTARTFTIRNSGTAPLTGLALATDGSASDFTVSALSTTTLAPGASTSFTVAFKPTAAGTRSAALHLASNDADENPFDIRLEGSGVAVPEIAIEQSDGGSLASGSAVMAFGSANIGSTGAVKSFSLKNLGTAPLTNLALTSDGSHAADFAVDGLPLTTLAAGASVTFQITFKPTAAGTRTAAIHVTSNDADESPYHISLSGTGVALPEIALNRADNTELADASSTLTSGNVNLGSTSAAQTITIRNTGSGNLTGLSITKNGAHASDFTVSSPAASSVAPGASTTFTVTFTPSAAGTRTAAIHLASNDADENPFDIALTGTGVPIPEIAVTRADSTGLTDSGSTVDSGKVNLGASGSAQTLTLKNLGTANLSGLSLSIDGANASDFTASALTADALAPGTATTFSITFTPSAAGSRWAVLHIASNDADENPFDIKLEGIGGTVPVLAIRQPDESWLTHGETTTDLGGVLLRSASAAQTITLKNIGTAPLTGLRAVSSGPHGADFITGALAQSTLAPGESTSFPVTFQPTAAGKRGAVLQFFSDDRIESAFSLILSGTGIAAPEIVVTPSSGEALRVSGGSSSFGSASVGSGTTTRSFTISNIGTANLSNLALSISGTHGWNFKAGALSKTTLAPGASTTFQITFTPSAAGTRTAALRVASNDADENPLEIALSGSGIPVPEIAVKLDGGANLTDNSAFINFGTVALSRSSAKKSLIITNTGSAPLTGLRLLKNGLNGPDFVVGSLRVTSLAPGASTAVSITFKPTITGTRWAAVHISSNDADEKVFDLVLTGKCNSASDMKKSSPFRAAATTAEVPAVSRIEVIDGKKYRTLTLTWPAGQRDFTRRVEVSSDLLHWFSGPRHTTVLLSDATTLKVRDNTPVTQDDKRHIRLKR